MIARAAMHMHTYSKSDQYFLRFSLKEQTSTSFAYMNSFSGNKLLMILSLALTIRIEEKIITHESKLVLKKTSRQW